MKTLSLDKCPHGMFAISLNSEHSGTRLTPNKCCGRWDEVKSWKLTSTQLREIANEFTCAADDEDDAG
jgi:hypothetical protein